MTAAELVAEARRVLAEDGPATRGLWSRVATHLARQALEHALAEFWDERSPGLSLASTRAQLICLRAYRPHDQDGCRRLAWTWSALSEASHGRGGLPTHSDLDGWISVIEHFVAASPQRPSRPSAPSAS